MLPHGSSTFGFWSFYRCRRRHPYYMDNNKFLDIYNMVFKNILFVYDQNFD